MCEYGSTYFEIWVHGCHLYKYVFLSSHGAWVPIWVQDSQVKVVVKYGCRTSMSREEVPLLLKFWLWSASPQWHELQRDEVRCN